MKALLWSVSAVMYPAFVRAPLRVFSCALRQSPYSARIEFEKVYTNPADHTELKRERWTATVTYVFRENVKNSELAVNPLGLTIVRFRADQAFS